MSKRKSRVVALIAAAVISSVAMPTQADQYSEQIMGEDHVSGGAILLDSLVARPVFAIGTAVGGALFLVVSPFAMAGGNVGTAWDTLVVSPAENAFARCLGCTPVQHERVRAERETEMANAQR